MDDIDRANTAMQEAMDNALAQRQQDEAESNGICQECGEEISRIRLSALPTAKRCVYCQAGEEKREGHFAR